MRAFTCSFKWVTPPILVSCRGEEQRQRAARRRKRSPTGSGAGRCSPTSINSLRKRRRICPRRGQDKPADEQAHHHTDPARSRSRPCVSTNRLNASAVGDKRVLDRCATCHCLITGVPLTLRTASR